MWYEHGVVAREQVWMNVGLALEYVEPSGEDLALHKRLGQGRLVNDRTARRIHQHGRGLHQGQACRVDQMARLRGEAGVQGDEVGFAEKILQVTILRSEFLLNLSGQDRKS